MRIDLVRIWRWHKASVAHAFVATMPPLVAGQCNEDPTWWLIFPQTTDLTAPPLPRRCAFTRHLVAAAWQRRRSGTLCESIPGAALAVLPSFRLPVFAAAASRTCFGQHLPQTLCSHCLRVHSSFCTVPLQRAQGLGLAFGKGIPERMQRKAWHSQHKKRTLQHKPKSWQQRASTCHDLTGALMRDVSEPKTLQEAGILHSRCASWLLARPPRGERRNRTKQRTNSHTGVGPAR